MCHVCAEMPRTIVNIVTLPNSLIQSMSVCLINLTYWSNYPDVVKQRWDTSPRQIIQICKSEYLNVRGEEDIRTSTYSEASSDK